MATWKAVVGYEGIYEVSDEGSVRSLDRYVKGKLGAGKQFIKGRELTPIKNQTGYYRLNLCNGDGRKAVFLHRIVAEAFIPRPEGATQLNHKDENPANNRADNLEWCTAKYNCNYGEHRKRLSESKKGKGTKRVVAIHKVTGSKKYYPSLRSVEADGHNVNAVYRAIYNKPHAHGGVSRSHHGYIWRYVDG